MMTIALAIVIPLSMLLYSNSKITEAKETLRAEMALLRADMMTEFAKLEVRFSSIDRKLDEILRILGDHETRITKLEHPPR
jgi:flagellar motor switch protein FliM